MAIALNQYERATCFIDTLTPPAEYKNTIGINFIDANCIFILSRWKLRSTKHAK